MSGRIDTMFRLFACRTCDHFWWRRVPNRKMVSKCDRCRRRYDPLPKEEEWGWAEFLCTYCGNQFAGWCGMWYTSPCYMCQSPVFPTHILPPLRKDGQRGRRNSRYIHKCGAPDCCGAVVGGHGQFAVQPQMPIVRGDDGRQLPVTCVYPVNRRARNLPIVILPSQVHDSTGSTVDTFLPQEDLTCVVDIIPMPSIHEVNNE